MYYSWSHYVIINVLSVKLPGLFTQLINNGGYFYIDNLVCTICWYTRNVRKEQYGNITIAIGITKLCIDTVRF